MSKIATDLSRVTTVRIDLAKHVFQDHAADASGKVIVAKALQRRDVVPFFASLPPCLGDGGFRVPIQAVIATQASNRSAGVS